MSPSVPFARNFLSVHKKPYRTGQYKTDKRIQRIDIKNHRSIPHISFSLLWQFSIKNRFINLLKFSKECRLPFLSFKRHRYFRHYACCCFYEILPFNFISKWQRRLILWKELKPLVYCRPSAFFPKTIMEAIGNFPRWTLWESNVQISRKAFLFL